MSEIDPYAWFRGKQPDDDVFYPGEIMSAMASSMNGPHEDHALAQAICNTGNSFIAFMEASKSVWRADIDHAEARKAFVYMYFMGAEAMRAAVLSHQPSEDTKALLESLRSDAIAENAKKAIDARHSKPGGAYERRNAIRKDWATGKYSSRDICAEQQWEYHGFGSFAAARKALRNTPDPT